MVQGTGSGRNIVLVTYDAHPRATDDDRYLVDALVRLGASVDERPWSDPTVQWEHYDAVIVRSCWDYFHRADEFHRWLDALEARGARVFNATSTLRWNADKAYLRDLDASGVPVIPTHWIDRGTDSTLEEVRRRTGWSELVVKPAVSGGAHRTWRASPGDLADDARLSAMAADGTVLIQPLVDEIESEGEWSLIFLDGRFSHAVIKRHAQAISACRRSTAVRSSRSSRRSRSSPTRRVRLARQCRRARCRSTRALTAAWWTTR